MNDALLVTLLPPGCSTARRWCWPVWGELLAERSGVMNLGVEAMMLMGAVTAFWTSQSSEAPGWIALASAIFAAALVGTAMGAVFAFTVVTLRASQIIAGLAMLILGGATGLSSYVASIGDLGNESGRHRLPDYSIFGLGDAPVIGP